MTIQAPAATLGCKSTTTTARDKRRQLRSTRDGHQFDCRSGIQITSTTTDRAAIGGSLAETLFAPARMARVAGKVIGHRVVLSKKARSRFTSLSPLTSRRSV